MTQYFREDRSGIRVPVKEYEYLADKQERGYRQIHQFGNLLVYKLV
jgi:hypothetical protein